MVTLFKETIFVDRWLDRNKYVGIKELLDKQHKELSTTDNWTYEGSGWTLQSILRHHLVGSETAACKRSSYFWLSKELNTTMSELINIQNDDNNSLDGPHLGTKSSNQRSSKNWKYL